MSSENFIGLDLTVPILFGLGVLALGFIKRQGKTKAEEFMLMSRQLALPAFVMSLVSSWYGGILGISEYSYNYGLSNWFVFGFPYYLHTAIFAMFIAKRARKSQHYSIPGKLEEVYGKNAGLIGAGVIFITTMPAAYYLMLGKISAWIFNWPYPVALAAGVFFSTIYVYSGGLRSIVRTDIFEFIVMYSGFAVMVFLLYRQYGGLSFLQNNLPKELFTPTGGQNFWAVFVWYIIATTTLIEPLFYERVYAAKNEKMVLPGLLVCIFFWAIFDFMTTSTGLYARAILGEISDPAYAFPVLAQKILPAGLFGLFLAALLATVMSTINSYTFIAASAMGRDLIWKSRKSKHLETIPGYIRLGLLITTAAGFFVALISDSIINLWHDLGSVAAPMLLIPMLTAWSKKHAFPQRFVIPSMLCSGTISLLWTFSKIFSAKETYWLNLEPIYAGLSISAAMYFLGKTQQSS